jgi:hypothetical protein
LLWYNRAGQENKDESDTSLALRSSPPVKETNHFADKYGELKQFTNVLKSFRKE